MSKCIIGVQVHFYCHFIDKWSAFSFKCSHFLITALCFQCYNTELGQESQFLSITNFQEGHVFVLHFSGKTNCVHNNARIVT